MADRSANTRRAVSPAPSGSDRSDLLESGAPGRLPGVTPVGVIDIGSNSVRLVVYEGLTRSPTPIFNEKALCGLGAQIATTGRLDAEAVEAALAALERFRALACSGALLFRGHARAWRLSSEKRFRTPPRNTVTQNGT